MDVKKKVYFDVCGTLFDVNTTFDFILFFHKKKNNHLKILLCLILKGIVGKIINRILKVSLRKMFFRTILNESHDDLFNIGSDYVDYILKNNKIEEVFKEFDFFVSKPLEFEVFLISASINPIIDNLSLKLNVKSYSSKLKFINERFSGDFNYDLKGNKNEVLNHKYNNYIFYSDNIDDLPCSKLVEIYYCILKKNKSKGDINFDSNNVRFLYV
ncbi:hypothetical protein [Vibrio casei]|uniref:hypothetical protein n=1 Tax=Vibrio casei TaxID=673372 RepID=UPI003F9BD324